LHNWCQEDAEFRRILAATRGDAAFDAALLDTIQMHHPDDLIWRRINEQEQPSVAIFNPRTDRLLFIRGEVRPGFRNDLVGGKRAVFTKDMKERGIKRPKHSVDAARARRYAE
jgi:N-acetylneuraminic acid mutarotase